MLKVFLVEDEVIIRNSIKKNINWEQEGFVFVGEAGDGELAFPLIQETQPDIVITDIKMPFMDGLEMSRLVKEEMPWVKIIVLSGYDEFSYAKEAINIGVTDYILKPVDSVKIIESLNRIGNIIQEEKKKQLLMERFQREKQESIRTEKTKFFYEIMDKKSTFAELIQKGKSFGVDLGATIYNVNLLQIFPKEEGTYSEELVKAMEQIERLLFEQSNVIWFEYGPESYAFLIKGTNEEDIKAIQNTYLLQITEMLQCFPSLEYFAGIGKPVKRQGDIVKSFDTANQVFCYRYLIPKNQIMDCQNEVMTFIQNNELNLKDVDIKKIGQKALEKFLRSGSNNEVDTFVEELFYSLGDNNVNSYLLRQYLVVDLNLGIIAFIEQIGGSYETQLDIDVDLGDILQHLNTLESTKEYLGSILKKTIDVRNDIAQNKYSNVIADAKHYIEKNYSSEDISLNRVSASVNISPSHFSTIFAQESGQTFIEFLTTVRMNKAKELLRSSSMKCSEIGYEVGYKDSHYFYYLFKKTQGTTPTDYRLRGKL
ncbi:MAG: response regulator [Lachnospiraceae bacterium]|nr:response regulator [Lachnospiraceae bacterium]